MRLATCSVLAAWMLSANTIADSAPTNTNESKEKTIEELVVIAKNDTRVVELAETINVNPDSAALLRKAVGANVVSNGPLTGIAQYRGMGRFRVNTQVNDIVISAGGTQLDGSAAVIRPSSAFGVARSLSGHYLGQCGAWRPSVGSLPPTRGGVHLAIEV